MSEPRFIIDHRSSELHPYLPALPVAGRQYALSGRQSSSGLPCTLQTRAAFPLHQILSLAMAFPMSQDPFNPILRRFKDTSYLVLGGLGRWCDVSSCFPKNRPQNAIITLSAEIYFLSRREAPVKMIYFRITGIYFPIAGGREAENRPK